MINTYFFLESSDKVTLSKSDIKDNRERADQGTLTLQIIYHAAVCQQCQNKVVTKKKESADQETLSQKIQISSDTFSLLQRLCHFLN